MEALNIPKSFDLFRSAGNESTVKNFASVQHLIDSQRRTETSREFAKIYFAAERYGAQLNGRKERSSLISSRHCART